MNSKFKSSKAKLLKKFFLLLPFILITLIFIIIPVCLVLVKAFIPASGGTVADNWAIINGFIWQKILTSFIVALLTTLFCLLIGFSFAYLLSGSRSKIFKTLVLFIITAPIWMSFLIKIVGLKCFFDIVAGYDNSTYGHIWTIIGLTYVYLPFMILPLYSVLNDMPRNLIYASYDLGCSKTRTLIKVVIPYCLGAMVSGITLVFLPSLTTVGVTQFLNNSTDASLIGNIIADMGDQALSNNAAIGAASAISLVIGAILIAGFIGYVIIRRLVSRKRSNHG